MLKLKYILLHLVLLSGTASSQRVSETRMFIDSLFNEIATRCYKNRISYNDSTPCVGDVIPVNSIKFLVSRNVTLFKHYSRDAYNIMDSMILFLKKNETVLIEVRGHLNRLSSKYSKRYIYHSMLIIDYFVKHGINRERLLPTHYHSSKPLLEFDIIAKNYHSDEKQYFASLVNNRFEFWIIKDFESQKDSSWIESPFNVKELNYIIKTPRQ